jgi:hypothetical protein
VTAQRSTRREKGAAKRERRARSSLQNEKSQRKGAKSSSMLRLCATSLEFFACQFGSDYLEVIIGCKDTKLS